MVQRALAEHDMGIADMKQAQVFAPPVPVNVFAPQVDGHGSVCHAGKNKHCVHARKAGLAGASCLHEGFLWPRTCYRQGGQPENQRKNDIKEIASTFCPTGILQAFKGHGIQRGKAAKGKIRVFPAKAKIAGEQCRVKNPQPAGQRVNPRPVQNQY